YATVGNVGYYVSVVLALVSLGFSKQLNKYWVAAIPVAVCPLVYWLVFEIAHLTSIYEGDLMRERNFDGYTGLTARYEFGFEVLGLLFWGTIIGLIIGFIIEKFSIAFTKKLA
ncbi:MAG: hypothetical protein M3Q26_00870, partial [Acidobacteriota bacterium]|nr:hypothetical protein [Acidobacteriota bacterium]